MSRGLSAMVHHHRGEFFGEDVEALFEVGQRDAVALGVVGVGGEVGAEFVVVVRACANRRRSAFVSMSMMSMMSAARSLPSSVPVMARISKRAAIEVAAVAEIELDRHERRGGCVDRLVERDGDVRRCRRAAASGDQPFSLRVSRTFSGR